MYLQTKRKEGREGGSIRQGGKEGGRGGEGGGRISLKTRLFNLAYSALQQI